MTQYNSKLSLNDIAYIVYGGLDPSIRAMTVGLVRVEDAGKYYEREPEYKEEYMCEETGIGYGQVYTYGKNIFATYTEAAAAVEREKVKYAEEIAERDAYRKKEAAAKEAEDLRTLKQLKEKYETR